MNGMGFTNHDIYDMACGMEADGCAHGLTLALALGALSPYFGANLVDEVNEGRMSFDEVIFALYLAAEAAPEMLEAA